MTSKAMFSLSLAGALTLGLCAPVPASATDAKATRTPPAGPDATDTGRLTPQQRGALTRQLVLKWGPYVQNLHGVPIATWAERMVPRLIKADPSNFRAALQRDTFEGAMAQLMGSGHRMSDEDVITRLASDGDGTQAFGDFEGDLVYTPVAPCRILDTRVAGGPIATNASRDFRVFGTVNHTDQGGSVSSCGLRYETASAAVVNLTAVSPVAAGFATAYPYGTTKPLAASLNYAAGATVNNSLIIQTSNPAGAFDFTLYTYAQSHYVADVVGYFAPPTRTRLECHTLTYNHIPVPISSEGTSVAHACGAGYVQTGLNCTTSDSTIRLTSSSYGTCVAKNYGNAAGTVGASRTCCRVPGR